jgi:hypothetical protein
MVGFKAHHNQPAEMIVKHLDKAMRKAKRTSSGAEFDAVSDVVHLYRIQGIRTLRTFYHRGLDKTLLLSSDDLRLKEGTYLLDGMQLLLKVFLVFGRIQT